MSELNFEKESTALLVVDPYYDFISDGGKLWDRVKNVAEANNCVPNMLNVMNASRNVGPRVFYALHHRYRPGDYATWKYIASVQKAKSLRERHVGWRDPRRTYASARRHCGPGALVFLATGMQFSTHNLAYKLSGLV